MYLQDILEVVIGLVFLWLVISLATMSFQEWIANIFNLRGKELEKKIFLMLGGKYLTHQFYTYPLIGNLCVHSKKTGKIVRLPSYIPANIFSSTLFQLVLQAGTDGSSFPTITDAVEKQMEAIESPEQQQLAWEDWDAILKTANQISTTGLGTAAVDSLKFQLHAFGEKYPELKSSTESLLPKLNSYFDLLMKAQGGATASTSGTGATMRQFRLGVQALQKANPQLSNSITALVKQTEGYVLGEEQFITTIRANMEAWFNDAMDRLSVEYKWKAQTFAFMIGLILALIFNIDSINMANSLWREPTLRQAITIQAENYGLPANSQDGSATSLAVSILALESQLHILKIPFGWTTVPLDPGGRRCSLLPPRGDEIWGIPSQDNQGRPICKVFGDLPKDIYAWLVKILGTLMTSTAASQGAPFWFDILKKMLNIRSASTSSPSQQAVG